MKPLWPIIGMVIVVDVLIVAMSLIFPWIGYAIFGLLFLFGVIIFFYPK
jgi:hypothetical protein